MLELIVGENFRLLFYLKLLAIVLKSCWSLFIILMLLKFLKMENPPVPAPANPAQGENAGLTPTDPDAPAPNLLAPANPVGLPCLF